MSSLVRCGIAAVVGGLIGASIWAGITYATGMEIGWIAWGVGLCVGVAVRVGAGETTDGIMPGGIAVVGAIAALMVGKYAAIHLLVGNEFGNLGEMSTVTAEDMQVGIADEVVEEWTTAGKTLQWPPGMDVEEAGSQADYPMDVWAEAVTRWNAIPAEEQQTQIQDRQKTMQMFGDMMSGEITKAAFKDSFSPIDFLFFGLAIFTAFKVGSGLARE